MQYPVQIKSEYTCNWPKYETKVFSYSITWPHILSFSGKFKKFGKFDVLRHIGMHV